MFQCYLDDSGTSGLPVITMAGFIAALNIWEDIEPKLDAVLDGYNVPVLHAKEFESSKPPFKTWTRLKKRSFAEEIFSACHGALYGLSITIAKDTFEQAKREERRWDTMSAMGVCFSSIMTRIVTDPQIGGAVKNSGVSFLIETGNKNNSEIEHFFHLMAKMPAFEGVLRSITFVSKSSCRAIQLADFLAYYSRRRMQTHHRFDGKLSLPSCPYLDIIYKHGPLWMQGGFGKPMQTGGNLRTNLTSLDSLTAFSKKPFP